MEYLEFHCSECRCGLRIRAEHREKTIRCPNCHALQRYVATPAAPTSSITSQAATSNQLDQGTWSLRMPDGIVLGNLSRESFENEVRARNLGHGTMFQGGDFTQWTPLEKLFQSQVPGKADRFGGGGWAGHSTQASTPIPVTTTGGPTPSPLVLGNPVAGPSASMPGPASAAYVPPQPNSTHAYGRALPLEQQLAAPRAGLVLAMGILGMLLPCTFIFSLIGLVVGIMDTMQIGNGTMSRQGNTMLTIGLVLCVLGIFTGGCCSLSIISN